MKNHFTKARTLAFSSTAKDTYIVFAGNLLSAFLGFVFTIIVARGLSVEDFGIFSAANNLVLIIAALSDLGISSAIVNFGAENLSKGNKKVAFAYFKAGYITRFCLVFAICIVVFIFAGPIARNLLATENKEVSYWVVILALAFFSWTYMPYILQAEKKFFKSALIDVSLGTVRAVVVGIFFLMGILNISLVMLSFTIGGIFSLVAGFKIIGTQFMKVKTQKKYFLELFKFSSWLGVNKILSAVSSRLDIQMLAGLVGATATALYSIPQRLAFFVTVLAGSFTSVLAPRLSAMDTKEKQIVYLKKATIALIPITLGIILWIIIAKPFILILFGEKYLPAVGIFQALTASMIPFLFTVPSVSAIIYALKKPKYIGIFSVFQLGGIFFLNSILIPRFSSYGPTITFSIINIILAVYSWVVVISFYKNNK